MTESMVERVARAMEASLGGRTNSSDANPIIDPLHPDLRAALPGMARAAIAAMRDLRWPEDDVNALMHGNTDPVPIYQGLIDAALKE